jgi:hypothetical protein
MKRPAGRKTVVRTLLLGAAGVAALFVTLPTLTGRATSTAADTPPQGAQRPAERNVPPEEARADRARPESPRIREAHSDGGYTYWLEHEGSRENSH